MISLLETLEKEQKLFLLTIKSFINISTNQNKLLSIILILMNIIFL